jgi:N4-gp56 family major capsid protein
MPDAYTTTASTNLVQTAYDRLAYFALRPQLYFDHLVDVQPTRQSMPGSAVIFTIVSDLAAASTAINESVDVSAVALSSSQVTLTLAEYGSAVITTAAFRGESFVEVDPVVANAVGFNAGLSIDNVIRDVAFSGTNVDYSTGDATTPTARNMLTVNDILVAANFRLEYARLMGNNVPQFGSHYAAIIHPDTAYDLRSQSGGANWRDPHVYSQPDEIWTGEIGDFEGFRVVVSPRTKVWADAGSSTTNTDVYGSLFMGRQALAKAYSYTDGNGPNPRVVAGPITDHLRRQQPVGWYWLGAYGTFRTAALRRVESASSIGQNLTLGSDQASINA